jgi:hypothetical protein
MTFGIAKQPAGFSAFARLKPRRCASRSLGFLQARHIKLVDISAALPVARSMLVFSAASAMWGKVSLSLPSTSCKKHLKQAIRGDLLTSATLTATEVHYARERLFPASTP